MRFNSDGEVLYAIMVTTFITILIGLCLYGMHMEKMHDMGCWEEPISGRNENLIWRCPVKKDMAYECVGKD
jgi:hypothetical protein